MQNTVRNLCCLLSLSLYLALLAQNAMAEEIKIEKALLPAHTPLTLEFEAYVSTGLFSEQREDFRVHIDAQTAASASLRYESRDPDGVWQEATKTVIANKLHCKALDPWWDSSPIQEKRCELWISRTALQALETRSDAEFLIDVSMRRDNYVSLQYQGRVAYPCIVSGKSTTLPAIVANSSRGDKLIILDQPQNPIVLQIDSSFFRWKLVEIR
ncbi:MAG: hypothetical protein WC966_03665 [Bradymonadales bacterium]|jgi:hypothetical protein